MNWCFMTPEQLKAFFRVAVFIMVVSTALLFIVPADSAEYVVTHMSLFVGALMTLLVMLVSWYINR